MAQAHTSNEISNHAVYYSDIVLLVLPLFILNFLILQ